MQFTTRKLGLVSMMTITLAGCQMQTPVLQSAVSVAPRMEEQGEFHPNNIQPFLESLKGERRTQAIDVKLVDPARSLMVTNINVVNDKVRTAQGGAWHFGTLMTRMAGKVAPSQFALNWLNSWKTAQTINGDSVPARAAIQSQVIDPWLKASGGKNLDLNKAPFRLLAIVNRLDLRTDGNAGEGRLVYGVLDASGNALPFTVIFEYGIPLAKVGSVKSWAQQWQNLSKHAIGSATYNAALQTITDTFTAANANPQKPNGSALNQLRTNEIALASPWELREFQVVSSGQLAPVTTKQSPRHNLNNTAALAKFLSDNSQSILAGKHVVPTNMLGGRSADVGKWTAPGANENVRKAFAVATCIGCHSSETGTFFLHVGTRSANSEAAISAFVKNTDLPFRARDLASLL